jgi:4-hydroxybenzoyl-CoA reductase subunit beta
MLTLPDFELLRPRTPAEAVALLAEHAGRARLVAGGTDLLVNMKHGLLEPDFLIDVTAIDGLDAVEITEDGGLRLGALLRLHRLAASLHVRARYPALAEAAGLVAGPQHQRMGTLGGNVCLDTRCVYINQTHFWRRSLGYCLKKDGTACYVVTTGKRCVAAQSSDTVPVLIALDARARLLGPGGERVVPVEALYQRDGAAHLALAPDELLTHIEIPPPWPRLHTAYQKLRIRKAIDYPVLSLAVAVAFDRDDRVTRLALVATALMATPRRVGNVDRVAVGHKLDTERVEALAERAYKQLVPLTNINVDPEWRREMVPILLRRALRELVPSRAIGAATGGGATEDAPTGGARTEEPLP